MKKLSPTGGVLIRKLIVALREAGVTLPLSRVMIGCSGGADSVALAHLLAHFGGRVVKRDQIRLVHVNHHWRGQQSNQDARFVAALGKKWGVPCLVLDQEKIGSTRPEGASPEAWARTRRCALLNETRKRGEWILSAHHADDLAETLIWRFLTGQMEGFRNGLGILPKNGHWLRPCLGIRKAEFMQYLKEQEQTWREDESNQWEGLLRSEMRKNLMPEIERIFPKSVENLALWARKNASRRKPARSWLHSLIVGLRANQYRELEKQLIRDTGAIRFRDGLSLEWDRRKPHLRLWKPISTN